MLVVNVANGRTTSKSVNGIRRPFFVRQTSPKFASVSLTPRPWRFCMGFDEMRCAIVAVDLVHIPRMVYPRILGHASRSLTPHAVTRSTLNQDPPRRISGQIATDTVPLTDATRVGGGVLTTKPEREKTKVKCIN